MFRTTAAGSARFFIQRGTQAHAGCPEGRNEAEKKRGERDDDKREGENANVESETEADLNGDDQMKASKGSGDFR